MRYLIAFICVVTFCAMLGLAAGQGANFVDAALLGLIACASGYIGTRVNRGVSRSRSTQALVYFILALVFASVILPVEAYRLYDGIGSGRLLVSTIAGWSVAWSNKPIGFILALLMHLALVAFWMIIAVVCVQEIKRRYDSRSGSAGGFIRLGEGER